MFIICWIWRALHRCYAYLLFVPLTPSVYVSHSPFPSLLLTVSLFISPSVTNLHHLPVSYFPFFPSLSLFTCCRSLSPSVFMHPHCLPLKLPSLPLPSVFYFVWLTSVVTLLPLVFCFVYVVSLDLLSCSSKDIKPYTHQHVVEDTLAASVPSGHLGEQRIYTYTSAHTHT